MKWGCFYMNKTEKTFNTLMDFFLASNTTVSKYVEKGNVMYYWWGCKVV